ncbi:MAG: GIY-YIG nuclease family protein [bacterium]|nr:GIY-YIG nuclease family protein [bacterium]
MPGTENSTRDYVFYYVYVLESLKDESELYIGVTNNLRKRVATHNRKDNFSTKACAPWKLIFYEAYLNKQDASRRERYLKTNKGSKVIKQMLKEYFYHKKVQSGHVEKLMSNF